MFDSDLILSMLNNCVQRLPNALSSFDLSIQDFTLNGLLNPQTYRPKLWLDSVLNFKKQTSRLAFGKVTDDEATVMLNQLYSVLFIQLTQLEFDDIGNLILLDEKIKREVTPIVKRHINSCRSHISLRLEANFKAKEHPTETVSYRLEPLLEKINFAFKALVEDSTKEYKFTGIKGLFDTNITQLYSQFFDILNKQTTWREKLLALEKLLTRAESSNQSHAIFYRSLSRLNIALNEILKLRDPDVVQFAEKCLNSLFFGHTLSLSPKPQRDR